MRNMLNLEGLYETPTGRWRATYRHEPKHDLQLHEEEYFVHFKCEDLSNPKNQATPERLLRLTIKEADAIQHGDAYEIKVREYLRAWLGTLEFDVTFGWDTGLHLDKVRYQAPN